VGTSTRAIALIAAVLLLILVVALVLGPRGTPVASPVPTGTDAPTASIVTAEPTPTGDASSSSPITNPDATEAPVAVLVGAGDIAECSEGADAETANLLETVDGIVFTLGDNVYEDGTSTEFRECYGPTWGRPSIKDRTMPVAGNHEYQTPGAEGYFRYFGAAAGDPAEGWYAYDAGAWRIYALNSNCGEIGGCGVGSAQERWLREDLAANPRTCVAAMWHHPRFSSGPHGNHESMADLWRTLENAGAELVLAGHDHSYERFGPQDVSGHADERGLIEFVVGTGGRDPYPLLAPLPNSLVRESPVFGVLRLELHAVAYDFEFLAVPGDDFTDSGSASCH
jgi:3',5'-cyclic AMP phosphodiesterase CpdA